MIMHKALNTRTDNPQVQLQLPSVDIKTKTKKKNHTYRQAHMHTHLTCICVCLVQVGGCVNLEVPKIPIKVLTIVAIVARIHQPILIPVLKNILIVMIDRLTEQQPAQHSCSHSEPDTSNAPHSWETPTSLGDGRGRRRQRHPVRV